MVHVTRRFGHLRSILVAVLASSSIVTAAFGAPVEAASSNRTAGTDRYSTAVEVARLVGGGSLTGLDRLIVVTGETYPDGLTASGLAGYLDEGGRSGRTAILLTRPDELPSVVADAIRASALPANRVFVVGGPSAVSDGVYASIGQAAGWNGSGVNPVARIFGQNRYETAREVVDFVRSTAGTSLPTSYRTVLVANGEGFPDALAGGALAYRNGHLIVLSPPPSAAKPSLDAIEGLSANCAILLGGPASLATQVGSQVAAKLVAGECRGDRIGGADRFETATLIASRFVEDNGSVGEILLVSGSDFADALTVAPLAAGKRPIVFTNSDRLPTATRAWLRANRGSLNRILVIGGTDTVQSEVVDDATNLIPSSRGGGGDGGGDDGGGDDGGGGVDETDFVLVVESDGPFDMDLPLKGSPVDPTDLWAARNDDVDVVIDWGDGAPPDCPTSVTTSGNVTCSYTTGGPYTITISRGAGAGPWLYQFGTTNFSYYTGVDKITDVISFGDLGIQNLAYAFNNAANPTMPDDFPDSVTYLRSMFENATTFNRDISSWDMSNVTNMDQMFYNAKAFNNGCEPGLVECPLDWNTSSLTSMYYVFGTYDPPMAFNQNLSSWDTSDVTTMYSMFTNATSFNNGCAVEVLTCPLTWDTTSVTDMNFLFQNASVFNQDIGTWNTGNVVGMESMFQNASAFAQDLSGWCVSQFAGAPFRFSLNAGALTLPIWGAAC